MLLAGDVGGTKVNIGLFDPELHASDRDAPALVVKASYPSADHAGLEEIVEAFLSSLGAARPAQLVSACFGVAGPVIDNHTETPNLPWTLDGTALGERFSVPRFELINDLVATGEGLPALKEAELHSLQPGVKSDPPGMAVLLAAGTGLGTSLLVPAHGRWRPWPSEGGHAGLAPRSEQEIELLRFLQRERGGRAIIDRTVSGPGLRSMHAFLHSADPAAANPQVTQSIEADPEQAPRLISEAGLDGTCELCSRALDLFVGLFGAVAANLALTALATGGVYIGGGIAPKILSRIEAGGFLAAFLDAGAHRSVLERVPVKVVLNPEAALLGASRRARRAMRPTQSKP